MARPSNLIVATVQRNQRLRGPTYSNQQNDFQAEVVRDLSSIQQEWNNKIVPLTSKLPDGTTDSTVDAIRNGLDGSSLYVNAAATAALSGGQYYNSIKSRPNVVYEQFVNLYTYVDNQISTLEDAINSNSAGGGLTTDQKEQIGDNIFDSNIPSSATSLDGLTTSHAGYILQLARDIYGTGSPTLNSNGTAILSNSVRAMVDALLETHNGNWDNNIALSHNTFTSVSPGFAPASGGGTSNYLRADGSWNAPIAAISIGSNITSSTVGSLLFAAAGSVLGQNNANLFWNNSTSSLGVRTATPTSALHSSGSEAFPTALTSSSIVLNDTHYTIRVDASSGSKTITLPAASSCYGRIYNVKKNDNSSNPVVIDGNSSELIDGTLTTSIDSQYEVLTIQSNGTSWDIL